MLFSSRVGRGSQVFSEEILGVGEIVQLRRKGSGTDAVEGVDVGHKIENGLDGVVFVLAAIEGLDKVTEGRSKKGRELHSLLPVTFAVSCGTLLHENGKAVQHDGTDEVGPTLAGLVLTFGPCLVGCHFTGWFHGVYSFSF
jgi:hypothetical protein